MAEDFKDIFDGYENNPAIALALIEWQRQEIESLTVNMNALGLAAKRLAEEKEALEKEVERLQMILDSYALQYGTVMDKHIVIERARQEAAREIFAEIERVVGKQYNHYVFGNNDLDSIEQDAIINFSDTLSDCFAELKKKYTEDKDEQASIQTDHKEEFEK